MMSDNKSKTTSTESCESESRLNQVPDALRYRAGFLLAQVSRIIFLMTAKSLEDLELSPRHLGVLDYLVSFGSCTQQRISDCVSIDRTTMVSVIDELEKAKLVLREANPNDRRCHKLCITSKGRGVYKAAKKIAEAEQKKFLSVLSKQEVDQLFDFLHRLYANQTKIS